MMKRASVSFGKSRVVDDELKAKLKYQTLLEEYLALQKENVAKKKKLQAARQRREAVLAEVRFLRHRHKLLVEVSDCNTEDLQMPSSGVQSNALECEGNHQLPETVTESLDHDLIDKSSVWKEEEEEGQCQNHDMEVRLAKESINSFVHDGSIGKRKMSWPNPSPYGGLIGQKGIS